MNCCWKYAVSFISVGTICCSIYAMEHDHLRVQTSLHAIHSIDSACQHREACDVEVPLAIRVGVQALPDVYIPEQHRTALFLGALDGAADMLVDAEPSSRTVWCTRAPVSLEKIEELRKFLVGDVFRTWRLMVALMDYAYDLVLLRNGKMPDDIIVECNHGKMPSPVEIIAGVRHGFMERYDLLVQEMPRDVACMFTRWVRSIVEMIVERDSQNFFDTFARFKVFSSDFYHWFELVAIVSKNKGRVSHDDHEKLDIDEVVLGKMITLCGDAPRSADADIAALLKTFDDPWFACDQLMIRTQAVDTAVAKLGDADLCAVVSFFWDEWKQRFVECCAELRV